MSKHGPNGSQPVIGLVGGIGSGKSLVARMFAEEGAHVIEADAIGHELLRCPEVIAALTERLGRAVLAPDGSIDRAALGELCFSDRARLDQLNAIVHPKLREELVGRISALRSDAASSGPIVLDAALLLDTDWHELCDVVVFVDAPWEVRRSRVAERGWSADHLARREKNQKSLDFKRRKSDHMLRNSSSVSHLHRQVRQLYQRLVR